MPRAFSYLRFSTPDQMKGDSFGRQSRMAADYAARRGLDLDENLTYDDLGVSAFRGKNAEVGALRAFRDAIEDDIVEQGDYLLVESLDRISRQTARKASRLLEEIVEAGVTLVTLTDGKEWTPGALDSFDWIMANVLLFRGHEESALKSHRNSEAWRSKRERALATGTRMTTWGPSWLRPEGDGWAVIPDRATIVRRIFAEHLRGDGVELIATRLNAEGVEPFTARGRPGVNTTSSKRRASMWHRSFIKRILDNPAVIGDYPIYEKRNGKRVEVGRSQGYFPAVIDRDTWEAVQALHFSRSPRRGAHAKHPLQNMFGGLLRCGRCGGSVYRMNQGGARGHGVYLVCRAAQSRAGCPGTVGKRGGRAERVSYDDAVDRFLYHMPDVIREAPAGLDLDEQIEQARQTVAGLEDMVDSVSGKIARQEAPAAEARILASALQQAQAELVELEAQAEVSHGRTVQRRLKELQAALSVEPLDVGRANTLLRQTFSSITVDFDTRELVLHWRHGGVSRCVFSAEAYGFEVAEEAEASPRR
jgi:DNA invertase Pin-like site-specific DNA recombinase